MALDNKSKWFLAAWITIGTGVVVFGVVLFSLYGITLGPISHEHAAWSSFGSLLSGFFMVASTGGTVATLLFLAHQNRQIQKTNAEQQKVTQAQLAAVNFEQYVNHRRFFMERLSELQSAFGNKFVFEESEALYNKVFPKNSPTNLEFSAEVNGSIENQNYLGRLNYHLTQLDEFSKKSDWGDNGGRKLIGLLVNISEILNLRMADEAFDGDVVFGERRTAINIYSADEFVAIAKAIYDSFMFYTGNSKFSGFVLPMGRSANDALMRFCLKNKGDPRVMDVQKIVPGLEVIEEIYFNLCDMDYADFQFLQPSYATLIDVFSSREGVMQLRDKMFLEDMVNVGCNSVSMALTHAVEGGGDYNLLKQTHKYFNVLLGLRH